jgi:hypothetical protein
MQQMRFFIDTHDRVTGTFPEQLSVDDFKGFYAQYEAACQEEGVVPLSTHVGFADGRAFCLNLAPDAEAVRRVHQKVGLPYDSITEVTSATPGDMFFQRRCA